MIKTVLFLIFALQGFVQTAQAQSNAELIVEMKRFQCRVEVSERQTQDTAHYLLSKAVAVLLEPSHNDESLLRESLKIELCSMKFDQDFQGAEIVEPIFRARKLFFEKTLKQFPVDYRAKLYKAFDLLERERKFGNG